MKIKVLIYVIVIAAVTAACGFGLYYVIDGLRSDGNTKNDSSVSDSAPQNTDVLSYAGVEGIAVYPEIEEITLRNSISVDCKVTTELDSMCDHYYSERSDNTPAQCSVKCGDEVKKGDVLYTVGSERITADKDGRVADISSPDGAFNVSVLNYDKITATAYIDYDDYRTISYDTEISVSDGSNEYTTAYISKIGSVIENDKVAIEISFKEYVMPGLPVTVIFFGEETIPMLFVPAKAVTFFGDLAICNRVIDETAMTYEEVEVRVGKMVTVVEDGMVLEYYPILDGIYAGETIVFVANSEAAVGSEAVNGWYDE